MRHQCKVTVLDKKCFPDLQERYLADPASGPCSCFEVGQEFLFSREDGRDDFWHFGRDLDPAFPCAEAWDCVSRYIYTALQGGSVTLADPSATRENIDAVETSSHLAHIDVQSSGYGYIGINAKFIPSIYVRRALMTVFDPTLVQNYYPGTLPSPSTATSRSSAGCMRHSPMTGSRHGRPNLTTTTTTPSHRHATGSSRIPTASL